MSEDTIDDDSITEAMWKAADLNGRILQGWETLISTSIIVVTL